MSNKNNNNKALLGKLSPAALQALRSVPNAGSNNKGTGMPNISSKQFAQLTQNIAGNMGIDLNQMMQQQLSLQMMPSTNPVDQIPDDPEKIREKLGLQKGEILVTAFNRKLFELLDTLKEQFPDEPAFVAGGAVVDRAMKSKDVEVRGSLLKQFKQEMSAHLDKFKNRTPETERLFLEDICPNVDMLKTLNIKKYWQELDEESQDHIFSVLNELSEYVITSDTFDGKTMLEFEKTAYEFVSGNKEMLRDAAEKRDLSKIPYLEMMFKVQQMVKGNPELKDLLTGGGGDSDDQNITDAEAVLRKFSMAGIPVGEKKQ